MPTVSRAESAFPRASFGLVPATQEGQFDVLYGGENRIRLYVWKMKPIFSL
jgi:hypothetical protein